MKELSLRVTRPDGAKLIAALAVFALAGWGCSSTKTEQAKVETGEPAVASAPVRLPAVIRSVQLEDTGSRATVEVKADRSLVWTSFRNPDGDLVIELPNSEPDSAVAALRPASGLVEVVDIEKVADAERPLTRLIVRTKEPSEHALTGEGDSLRLELLPIESAQAVALAYEPIAEEEAEEPEVAQQNEPEPARDEPIQPEPERVVVADSKSAPKAYAGPDRPVSGPSPTGVAASQLLDVQVLEKAQTTEVRIEGDGEFAYSSFRLQNPERFILDLRGVVNSASASTLPVGSMHVEQIRIGQFKPRPEPVSRVVFDLREEAIPVITRTSEGLVLTFGSAGAVVTAEASRPSVPAEETEVEEPVVASIDPQESTESVDDAEPETTLAQAYGEPTKVSSPVPDRIASTPIYQPAPARNTGAPSGGEAMAIAGSATAPRTSAAVEMFEAQQVAVTDDAKVERERLLKAFGSLVINQVEREYVGEPISMSLKNADLVETLRSFAKISDLNFVIQPGVRGSVTVELKSVPWDQAMEQILKINNLGMDIDGTIVRIAPIDKLRAEAEEQARVVRAQQEVQPLRTVMRSLSYSLANEVATLIRSPPSLLSRRGSVQVDQRTNSLIIRDLPETIDTVLGVIDNLDTAPPQVSIEARMVEATKAFSRSLGIQWGYDFIADQVNGNTTGLQFPNTVDTDGGVGLLTGGANGFLNVTLGNILDTFRLNARLQVAESEGLIHVVSAPRVTTVNNVAASIQSGLQIPIQTVSDRTVSVQFVNATLSLNVTPHVTAEGTILLEINVAKRTPQLAFAIVGATNAPIATKEARTQVIVRDGGTAVIGGIYDVQSNQNQDRVPGLANIPILGHLFKNRTRRESNDELMIFITPRIVQL